MSIPQTGGEPVESYDQLVEYCAAGSKPASDWRIGTEHEKFGFIEATGQPLPYSGDCSIRVLLQGLRDEFGWGEICEAGNIIGLQKDGANISLEPGGQLELSGAPLKTLHETCDEVNEHLRQVRSLADRIGARFVGIGAAPDWHHDEMPVMPKGRYRLMTDYMRQVGIFGVAMMYRTCTVQVNLDYSSEADMVRKLRVGLALQPLATALFANSPYFEGRRTGLLSTRSRFWRDLDADRTGMLPFVFDEGFGFQAWTDYALDVPMYFVYRDGVYHDALGQSFRDFMQGRLPALPGEKPLMSDWADHLTTIFPEARVKRFIELRGADAGPWRSLCALPAFWTGIFYHQPALDAAWDMVKNWDSETREGLRVVAGQRGFEGEFNGIHIGKSAESALALATEGLKARAAQGVGGMVPDETHFLNSLHDSIETGLTPAEELMHRVDAEWDGDLRRILRECSY
ncbi:MAG: glutamate--cysteine ligase [Rhodobacteraceae bacterium]|nr:glutamate--cysteine ligase [Paracoccaceae bacterium]